MRYLTAAGLLLLLILITLLNKGWVRSLFENDEETTRPEVVITPEPPARPVLADTMLEKFASKDTSDPDDLELFARFLNSVFLLVKQKDSSDYATNEDLALFLLGANGHKEPFLNKTSPALDDQGRLVDRRGNPIIVHPVSRKLLELRFVGPDGKGYTEDDLVWPDRDP